MAQLIDHVDALAREIGPRPAGTEEERQAALYIADQLQSEAGFPAVVEDFTCSSNFTHTKAICAIVTIVFAILTIILPVVTIPALIVSIIAAVVFVLESTGNRILTDRLARGASQNVVAKYVPGENQNRSSRRRKVILVAHYDSGRVESGFSTMLRSLNLPLPWIFVGGMVAVPIFLLIYLIGFSSAGRMPIVLIVLTIIAIIVCAIPVVLEAMTMSAQFNEGANDNASGVAVMLDVASAIGNGRVSEAELAELGSDAIIYGEQAARKEDLIPEGAQLVYEATQIQSPEPFEQTSDQRLASAKAAIAALTGEPVRSWNTPTIADNLVQINDAPLAEPTQQQIDAQREETREALSGAPIEIIDADAPQERIDASQAAAAAKDFQASGERALPDWFVAAQLKAKKPKGDATVSRSRYADALDNAAALEAAQNEAEAAPEEEPVEQVIVVESVPEESAAEPEQPLEADAEPAAAQGAQEEGVFEGEQASPVEGAEPAQPEVEDSSHIKLPSFLDPWKTQAKTLEAREGVSRSTERVDVTGARIAPSGRVDINDGAYIEDPLEAAEREDESFASLGVVEHHPVVLPDVADQNALASAEGVEMHQYAPLSQTDAQGEVGVHSALSQVPSISLGGVPGEISGLAPTRSGAMRSLRAKLPHLSGSMAPIGEASEQTSSVSTVGSFVAAGVTGTFDPVGDELVQDIAPEDVYVDDADDSDIEENYTESGAFAGPDYMEMPKSRVGGFFSKLGFGRKNKKNYDLEESPQEWLDVDDSFDPRQEGKRRGGWESFQNESADYERSVYEDADDSAFYSEPAPEPAYEPKSKDPFDFLDEDLGETTEFAPVQNKRDFVDDFYDDDFYDDGFDGGRGGRGNKWRGGAFSRVDLGRVDTTSSSEIDAEDLSRALDDNIETPEEIKQIYQFRNPNFNTEVWFVALGAQVDLNDGIKAFLREHGDDMRGAIIVDLQACAAGSLSLVVEEGTIKRTKVSSRMNRFIKKASSSSGVAVNSVKLNNFESAASVAMQNGVQGFHLTGTENGMIALSGSAQDIADNVDVARLEDNAVFVTELVRAI